MARHSAHEKLLRDVQERIKFYAIYLEMDDISSDEELSTRVKFDIHEIGKEGDDGLSNARFQ